MTVSIKNNRLYQETIRLTTSFSGKDEMISEKIDKEKDVKMSISSSEIGDQILSLRLTGPNVDLKTTRNIRIYDIPEIDITTRYDYDKNIATLDIESKKDNAKDITIEINGISKKIESPSRKAHLDFDLPVGTYDAAIKYTDFGGTLHIKNTTIEIKEMTILEKITSFIRKIIGIVAGLLA